MNCCKLFASAIAVTLVMSFVGGCGASTPIPPTPTPIPVPPAPTVTPTLIPPTATPTVFAIFDPEYIYIDPSLGETPYANESILIAQPDELKGGSIIAILGKDGKPALYDHFNLKSHPSSGNIVSTLFSNGTEHTIIGEISLGDYYVFKSSKEDPLRFRCDVQKGYVYVGGQGTVKMPNGTIVELGK
jgi:hypothetical protein